MDSYAALQGIGPKSNVPVYYEVIDMCAALPDGVGNGQRTAQIPLSHGIAHKLMDGCRTY